MKQITGLGVTMIEKIKEGGKRKQKYKRVIIIIAIIAIIILILN